MFRRVQLTLTVSVFTMFFLAVPSSSRAQYATVGPNGGVVLLNGPVMALPAANSQARAGISLADRTGISNNAAETAEVMTVGSGGALYNGAAIGNGAAVYNGSAVGTTAVPDGNVPQPSGTATRTRRDGGNSVFVGEGPVAETIKPAEGAPTLAEIAAKLKASQRKSKRTYTNADAQRINDNLQMKRMNQQNQPSPQPPQ